MTEDKCPDCGAPGVGGRDGCQALFDQMRAQAFGDLRYAAVIDLAFDAYCMQHVDKYCRSAKSYAAHLTRLCCGVEFKASPAIYAAIQKWLNGSISIEKPARLTNLGTPIGVTIADVQNARDADAHTKLVRDWASNVWDAYSEQHDIAKAWIIAATKLR